MSTAKVGEHISSGFSMSAVSSFKSLEKMHNVYRGKDYMKKFCEFSRGHTMEIILKIKKTKLLKKEQKVIKSVMFVRKILKINILKIKNIVKLEIIVQGNIEMLHIAYAI